MKVARNAVLVILMSLVSPGPFAGASKRAERAIGTVFLNYSPPTVEMSDEAFMVVIAPCMAKAKETFPEAHAKFEKTRRSGSLMIVFRALPTEGNIWDLHVLMVEHSSSELVEAREWMGSVRESNLKPRLRFPDSEVVDWILASPDESVEGNWIHGCLQKTESAKLQSDAQPPHSGDGVRRRHG